LKRICKNLSKSQKAALKTKLWIPSRKIQNFYFLTQKKIENKIKIWTFYHSCSPKRKLGKWDSAALLKSFER